MARLPKIIRGSELAQGDRSIAVSVLADPELEGAEVIATNGIKPKSNERMVVVLRTGQFLYVGEGDVFTPKD